MKCTCQVSKKFEKTLDGMHLFWCNTSSFNEAQLWPGCAPQKGSHVWITKLRWGVLRLLTPVGPRYLLPSFLERLYLIWVFRHFEVLPQQVLSRHTQSLIDNLCARNHRGSNHFLYAITDQPLIGTVERLATPGVPHGTTSMARGVEPITVSFRHTE